MTKILTLFSLALSWQLTAQINWDSPALLSDSMVNSSDPQVVIDSNGNAVAVWIQNNEVHSSTKSGMSWSAEEKISGTDSSASHPRIGMDSSGIVIAVWLEGTTVHANRYDGSWSMTVDTVSSSGASTPEIAVDSAGNAVAVWQSTVMNSYIESSTKLAGAMTSWTTVQPISTDGYEDIPSVAISDSGAVTVVWHTQAGGYDSIKGATGSIGMSGTTWNSDAYISTYVTPTFNSYPKASIDSSGNAMAVWFQYETREVETAPMVFATQFFNVVPVAATLPIADIVSQNWSTPTVLGEPSLYDPANLSLRAVFDNMGDAFVLWTASTNGSSLNVSAAFKPVNQAWNLGSNVILDNINAYDADVALSSFGNAIVNNMGFDGSSVNIFSQETNISGTTLGLFTTQIGLSTSGVNGFPRVAVSLTYDMMMNQYTLNAASVWVNNDGMIVSIQASTGTETLLQSPDPSSLMVSQTTDDQDIFVDNYNTFSWSASPSMDVIAYQIYRNGIFIALVPASTMPLEYVDHNQASGGPVLYGISAVDSNLNVSPIVTINYP